MQGASLRQTELQVLLWALHLVALLTPLSCQQAGLLLRQLLMPL